MKSVLFSAVVTLAMFGLTANAAEIKTDSEAIAACKTHVEETYSNVQRSKLKKIRSKSGRYEVRLTVRHSDQKEVIQCNVDKNTGAVTTGTGK